MDVGELSVPPLVAFLHHEIMKLAGLEQGDRLALMAAWEIAKDKAWNCNACLATSMEKLRLKKGCLGSVKVKYRLGEFKLKTCVGNLFDPTASALIGAYFQFKNGIMPYAGSYMEQPAKILEAFSLFTELEIKDAEDRASKNKK